MRVQAPESTCLVVMESSDYIPGSERRAGAIASSSVADHQMRIISIERHLRGAFAAYTVYSVLRSRPHERDTVLQWPDRRRQRPVGH